MDGFNGILDILMEEEVMMIKDRLMDAKKLLVDCWLLKKLNSKGKDSKKFRQTLLHWCYELN